MNIDLSSLAFGSTLRTPGGSPSWGTALGQSLPELKITVPGSDRVVIGMLYCSVPTHYVSLPLGKGGRRVSGAEEDGIQLTAVFHKVFINDVKIDYPFIMALCKEDTETFAGRRSIKYSDKTEYNGPDGSFKNEIFFERARLALGLTDEACWFVFNLDIEDQDTLKLSAIIVNATDNVLYPNAKDRKKTWKMLVEDYKAKLAAVTPGDGSEYDIDCTEYIKLLREKHNLVLTGAPGTGKTWLTKAIANQMKAVTQFVQFHPSYDYTDFVEGLRPTLPEESGDKIESGVSFDRIDGIFKDFCKTAIESLKYEETKDTPYVFIIDEINRGELSKILGELFFAIDPGYRGEDGLVATQYQRLITDSGDVFIDGFYVPNNVYILGTMNDIDRSVESMDFAIRRRFGWKEVTAAESAENMHLTDFAKSKMNALNAALKAKDFDEAFFIGGAYFRTITKDNFQDVWDYHIKGLVSEYFRGIPEASIKVEEIHQAFVNA